MKRLVPAAMIVAAAVATAVRAGQAPPRSAKEGVYTIEQAMTTSPHGFTGLHKMLVEGSELQWWCSST